MPIGRSLKISQLTPSTQLLGGRVSTVLHKKTLFDTTKSFLHTPSTLQPAKCVTSPYHISKRYFAFNAQSDKVQVKDLSNVPGLLGVKGLHTPDDFMKLYETKYAQVQERVALLNENTTSHLTLQWIDDISSLLCDIVDVADIVRNVHHDTTWVQAADAVWMQGQELFSVMSLNSSVIKALVSLALNKEQWSNMTLEGRRIVLDLLSRMNKRDNDDVADEYIVNISQEVCNLESEIAFAQPKHVYASIGMKKIPSALEPFVEKNYVKLENGVVCVYTHPSVLDEIVSTLEDSKLRKVILALTNTSYKDLEKPYYDLFKARYINAALHGSPSASHMAAKGLLCKDPIFTISRLLNLQKHIEPIITYEMNFLQHRASQQFTDNGKAGSILKRLFVADPSATTPIELGDIRYLINQSLKRLKVEVDGQEKSVADTVEYFPLWSVFDGIDLLLRQTLKLKLTLALPTVSEDWYLTEQEKKTLQKTVGEDIHQLPSTSINMKVLIQTVDTNETIGDIYLDLFDHPNKKIGDSQFVVKCRRVNHDDATAEPLPLSLETSDKASSAILFQLRPIPITPNIIQDSNDATKHLVSDVLLDQLQKPEEENYNNPNDTLESFTVRTLRQYDTTKFKYLPSFLTPCSPIDPDTNKVMHVDDIRYMKSVYCIAPNQVHNIFHEFGHALHTLLSESRYQHFSGSRAEMDFVETPSTLWEHFANDEQFIERFAKSCLTGKSISSSLAKMITAHTHGFLGLETSNVLFKALLDLRLHGIPAPYNDKALFPYLYFNDDTQQYELKDVFKQYVFKPDVLVNNAKQMYSGEKSFPLSMEDITKISKQIYANTQHVSVNQVTYPPHLHVSHLVHYGGVYFTYIVCGAYATLLRELLTKTDSSTGKMVINEEQGKRYRDILLSAGGTRSGLDILADLLELPGQENQYEFNSELENIVVENDLYREAGQKVIEAYKWGNDELTERQKKVIDLALQSYVNDIATKSLASLEQLEKYF